MAVVATTAAIAEAARRAIEVTYAPLAAVFDPEQARTPALRSSIPDPHPEDRVAEAHRNVIASFHEGFGGDPDEALAASHTTVSGTWSTARVTHGQLETHGSAGYLDENGRLVIRTSTQVPFLVRDELSLLFELPRRRSGYSAPASAADSAANRSCSPKTLSHWQFCGPGCRAPTR